LLKLLGKLYAMKILVKKEIIAKKQTKNTKTERKILESLNNPFIVQLHYAFQTKTRLYLVLDFMQGGELFY
jgi:serine/threonine protein kinase